MDDLENKTSNELLFEIKQLYLEDLKSVLSNNELVSNNKLIELIEKENNIMIDKTIKSLNEIIPKTEQNNNNKLENLLNNFKEDIYKNINSGNMNINDISLLIDNKYNNLLNNIQQSIVLHIGGSEDRIYKSLTELRDIESQNISLQSHVNTNIMEYINKTTNNSMKKGAHGETILLEILQGLFPSGEVINNTGKAKSGDILLKRNNKIPILFENKVYSNPVNKDEVIKFKRDIEFNNISGIMISQTSSISTKENLEIEILNGNILIYIHNCNYSHDIILVGINIIDHLSNTLSNLSSNTQEKFYIKNEVLININDEYQRFFNKRNSIKNYITDITKKLLTDLSELELPNLRNILTSQFAIGQENKYRCTICNNFIGINNKSLSKHKQSCAKKHNIKHKLNENISDDEIEIKENISDEIEIKETLNETISDEIEISETKSIQELSENKKVIKKKIKINKNK